MILHCGYHFVIEYLGEIETEFKNTVACLSGAQMGLNHEKNGDRKSRDTLPLSTDVTPLLRICSKCLSFSYQVSVLATLLLFNSTCTDTSSHSLVNYRYRHFKRDKRCISTTLNKRREGYGGYESKGNVGSGSESKRFWLHYTTLHYEHFFNLINLPLHVL